MAIVSAWCASTMLPTSVALACTSATRAATMADGADTRRRLPTSILQRFGQRWKRGHRVV